MILVLKRSTLDLKELELKEIRLDEVLASKLDASQGNWLAQVTNRL